MSMNKTDIIETLERRHRIDAREDKKPIREQLARDVEAFFAQGRAPSVFPQGHSGYETSVIWKQTGNDLRKKGKRGHRARYGDRETARRLQGTDHLRRVR